ncbi:M10 family metallopeptidase C-terminal domain-containing protein, partial [Nostoc sp. NIES-2111]
MIHELGHSFGLKHPFVPSEGNSAVLPAAHDALEYTVETYRSYPGAPLGPYPNEWYGFPTTYMMNDIQALQTLYGANYTTNSSDTVYRWDPATGQEFINGVGQPVPGNGFGGLAANRVFMTVWDGNGTDTYDLSNYATPVSINLNPGGFSLTASGQRAYLGAGHYAAGNVYNAYLVEGDPRSYIENAIGGSGNDRIVGNPVANQLEGRAGNDSLIGGAGDDTLIGGTGSDGMAGGTGNDTYDVDSTGDVVSEAGGSGVDLVRASGNFSLSDTKHAVGAIESLELLGNAITGTGNALANLIIGNALANTLIGGAGADHMVGGTGSDTYGVDNAGDVGDETGGDGTDLVQSAVSFSLSDPVHALGAVENLTLLGTAALSGVGNALANVITGNAGANLLTGLDGADTLIGGAGADHMVGGTGSDT